MEYFWSCVLILTLLICVGANRPGIINSIELDVSNYKIQTLQDGVFGIDITGFDNNFQLILAEGADQFVSDKFLDSELFYVKGKVYVNNQQIGTAFGEIRKGENMLKQSRNQCY